MSSLRGEVAHVDRQPSQARLDDPNAQSRSRQQRGLSAVAEAHAVDRDILGEQERAERPLDELDVRQRRGEVTAGRGEYGRLADLAADLDADPRGRGAGG